MQKKQRIPKNTKEQRTKKAKGASAYDEALYFLTPKARTVREVENRLDECNYSEGEIMAAIDRLRNNGLLNDEKFARDFIEQRGLAYVRYSKHHDAKRSANLSLGFKLSELVCKQPSHGAGEAVYALAAFCVRFENGYPLRLKILSPPCGDIGVGKVGPVEDDKSRLSCREPVNIRVAA